MESFDINKAPLEIERRYLIEYPDTELIASMPDHRAVHIEQTYLTADDEFVGGRIRRVTDGHTVRYEYNYKLRLSDVTRHEYEREISEAEYNELLARKAPGTITIEKDRHRFSYSGLTYELDIYGFWSDKATVEAEVDSEDTSIPIPPCVRLIKEVTYDRRYNNSHLAVNRGIIE